MKNLKMFLAGAFFYVLPLTSSHAETTPLSMTISLTPAKIDPNDDFFIDIKLENIGNKPLHVGHFKTLITNVSPYKVHVMDESGRLVTYRTDLRHPDQLSPFIETSLVTLQPSEFFVDRIVLDDLLDLSRSGQYTVEIDRKLPPEWGGWELHSNRITITIP
jgi:hypothetical protein